MIAERRLAAQLLSTHAAKSAADVVRSLLAVQAQDYAGCKWAIGARLGRARLSDADVEKEIDDGSLIRIHAMRWTWQLVAREDVRLLLELVGPRLIARYENVHRELDIDAALMRRSERIFAKALRARGFLTRDELSEALAADGIKAEGRRLGHLVGLAELNEVLCNGPRRARQFTYALLDDRVSKRTGQFDREQGLAEVARRYFESRGPATTADFTWWVGLSAAESRAGIEAAAGQLTSEEVDGVRYWSAQKAARSKATSALLLPAFDEYLIAYKDRSAVLDPKHVGRVNAGGGMLDPIVVLDGRVIGTWRRTVAKKAVDVEVNLFAPASAAVKEEIASRAQVYAAFIGLPLALRFGKRAARKR